MAEHHAAGKDDNPGFETTDAHIKPLVQSGIVLAIITAASLFSMVVLFKVFNYYQPLFDDPVSPLVETRQVSEEPRLQIDPPRQKADLIESENTLLGTYGWVDKEARVARIPVDRAIQLISQGRFSLQLPRPKVQ